MLDDFAFRALAESIREEREQLELEVADLRWIVGQDGPSEGLTPKDLWSKDPVALKAALSRYLRWIALTDKGVIAYSTHGTYMSARFIEKDLTTYNTADNIRTIEPPDLDATVDSVDWIADKAVFAAGRRYSLGAHGARLPIEALVPDWLDDELRSAT